MAKGRARDGVFERKGKEDKRPGWYASYIDADGVRRKRKLKGASTRTQALEALERINVAEQKARTLGVREASDITLADLLKRFDRHQKTHLRPTTYARLGGILETLKANLPALAKSINKKTVAQYIETRSEDVAPATVIKEIQTLSHALKLAVEWGELHTNPCLGVRLPKLPPGKTRYLTPGELKAALEIAPDWMRPVMGLAVATGARRGSLLALRWMDVDEKNRRLYLRETKTGDVQVLPINDAAGMVLGSLTRGASADLVFPDVDAQKLSVYTKRVFERIGIADASFHTLRHTAASWAVQAGEGLYAVGQFLGHKTPRMTQRYAHLSPDYMAKTAGAVGAVALQALSASHGLALVPTESPDKNAKL